MRRDGRAVRLRSMALNKGGLFMDDMRKTLIQRTWRVPRLAEKGDGTGPARQLDIVLMAAGFKMSGGLLGHLFS